jgi:solute carrier family 35 protein E1
LFIHHNIIISVVNKKLLNVLPAPLTVGSIQFGVGGLYIGILWLLKLRARPTLESAGKMAVVVVGFWHCTGQLASMVSLGAGPVSFTHIVKALEPFFSAGVSALYFGKWMKPQVYATLLPVVGGVGYACLKERYFSWVAFSFAMISNVAFAFRAVLSKVAMTGTGIGTNLSSTNIFGLVTWAAFFISIPMAVVGEGSSFGGLWTTALKTQDEMELVKAIVVSGMFHYLNNEVMYLALGNVHPVTLAVGNTMKRVIIMVASVMVFHNEISLQAGIGSGVGISGVLLYSLTKQYYEKVEQQEAKALLASKKKKVTDGVNRARIAERR